MVDLVVHFGHDGTIELVKDRFYWLGLKRNMTKAIECCCTYRLAKATTKNIGLYTPLLVPHQPWEDLNMDFILGFQKKF